MIPGLSWLPHRLCGFPACYYLKNELIMMTKANISMNLHMNTKMIQPGQRTVLLGQVEGSWSTVSICLWNQVSSSSALLSSSDNYWKSWEWCQRSVPAYLGVVWLSVSSCFCPLGSVAVSVLAGGRHTCRALQSVVHLRQLHVSFSFGFFSCRAVPGKRLQYMFFVFLDFPGVCLFLSPRLPPFPLRGNCKLRV